MNRFPQRVFTPPSAYLIMLILLSLYIPTAGAELVFNGPEGHPVARFDNSGIYLRGRLRSGTTIVNPTAGKKCWKLLDSSQNILLLLALEPMNATIGGASTPLVAGDLTIKGAITGTQQTNPAYHLDSSGTPYFSVDANGNMFVLGYSSSNYSDKIHAFEISVEINSAKILTPPFCNNEQEALYSINRGSVYDYLNAAGTATPTPNPDPTPTSTFSYMNTMFGYGDSWPLTWAGYDAQGNPKLILSNMDGNGMAYRTQWNPLSGTPPEYGYAYYNWPYRHETNGTITVDHNYEPNVGVSTFVGRPSDNCATMKMDSTYISHVDDSLLEEITPNSFCQTIARFVDKSANPDHEPVSEQDLDSLHQQAFFIDEGRNKYNAYIVSHMINDSGIICIKDKTGIRSLYMACNLLKESYPMYDPRGRENFPLNGCFILKSGEDAQNPLGTKWEPVTDEPTADTLPLIDLSYYYGESQNPPRSEFTNAVVWPPPQNKFTMPVFIQFGNEYTDYKLAPLEENETATPIWDRQINGSDPGGYYVYAIAAEDRYFFTSSLWLGRVRMRHGHPTDIWKYPEVAAYPWEYWAGTDKDGKQIWVTDRINATEILYSYNELAWPTVMYHAPSNRFLMTTFTASDKGVWDGVTEGMIGWEHYCKDPGGGRFDCRWFLWEAPHPWGPWKKIFTNDYNGRQNDIPNVKGANGVDRDLIGFCGYAVQLVPAWTESDQSDGGWNIWAVQAGFESNFSMWNTFDPGDTDWTDGGTYSPQFIKIHLSPQASSLSGSESAMSNYQQNCTRRNEELMVGAQFKVPQLPAGHQINVTHLGRYRATGDKYSHWIKLYDVTGRIGTGTIDRWDTNPPPGHFLTPIASLYLNLADNNPVDEHAFSYGSVTCTIGSDSEDRYYVLESEEYANSDNFYGQYDNIDWPSTKYVKSMTDLRGGYLVQFENGVEYNPTNGTTAPWNLYHDNNKTNYTHRYSSPGTHPGNSIGLVNLLYTYNRPPSDPQPSTFSNWVEPFSQTNNMDAWIGCKFKLKKDIVITHLGRYQIPGNNKKHEIRLIHFEPSITKSQVILETYPHPPYPTPTPTPRVLPAISRLARYITVATAVVDMTQTPESGDNNFIYTKLRTPVRISPIIRVRPQENTSEPEFHEETGDVDAPYYFLVSREYSGAMDSFYGIKENLSSIPQFWVAPFELFSATDEIKAGHFPVDSTSKAIIYTWDQWTNDNPADGHHCAGPLNMKIK